MDASKSRTQAKASSSPEPRPATARSLAAVARLVVAVARARTRCPSLLHLIPPAPHTTFPRPTSNFFSLAKLPDRCEATRSSPSGATIDAAPLHASCPSGPSASLLAGLVLALPAPLGPSASFLGAETRRCRHGIGVSARLCKPNSHASPAPDSESLRVEHEQHLRCFRGQGRVLCMFVFLCYPPLFPGLPMPFSAGRIFCLPAASCRGAFVAPLPFSPSRPRPRLSLTGALQPGRFESPTPRRPTS